MTGAPNTATTPTPQNDREATITTALLVARDRHDRCDDFDGAAGAVDGTNVVYCATCKQILLRWGGGDE